MDSEKQAFIPTASSPTAKKRSLCWHSCDHIGTVYSNEEKEEELHQHLTQYFEMTVGDEIACMVGIHVTETDAHIRLSHKACRTNTQKLVTTATENHRLDKYLPKGFDTAKFQALVGSLICLAQFASNPGPEHWVAGKRILLYLNGTISHGQRIPEPILEK